MCAAQQQDPKPASSALDEHGNPKRQIILLQSVFERRPAVLLFTYTAECGASQRPLERAVWADLDAPKLYYILVQVNFNAIINTLRHSGLYRIVESSAKFSVRWAPRPSAELLQSLTPNQRVSGYPGCNHLSRKDLLWQNISRMQRRFGDAFDIMPRTYTFPLGLTKWKRQFMGKSESLWIWKPAGQSCGRGIKVFHANSVPPELTQSGPKLGIVQDYLRNPLLIDGYKFDLRVYVVVLSFNPLKVYINDEGLVRLATTKFSSDVSELDSRTMHLTNYSVNKLSEDFIQNQDGKDAKGRSEEAEANAGEPEDSTASKWSFAELRRYFQGQSIDYEEVFANISDVILKSLISCEKPMKADWARMVNENTDASNNTANSWGSRPDGAHPASCFQVFGFDVILDEAMKVWLLEINCWPSLSSGSPLDKRIKTKLVADTLTLVGVKPPPGYISAQSCLKSVFGEVEGVKTGGDEVMAANVADCSPEEALAAFDSSAWNIVLDAHDEEMRSGGLNRIFPSSLSHRYLPWFEEETYANVVLRKWYEAGGAAVFERSGAHSLPDWVPRPVRLTRT